MRITEKLVNSPEEEGVTLEYIRLTKDFEEIKEYVRHKGDTLTEYRQTKEKEEADKINRRIAERRRKKENEE